MNTEWPSSLRPYKKNPPKETVAVVMLVRSNIKFVRLALYAIQYFTGIPYTLIVVNNQSNLQTKRPLMGMSRHHNFWLLDNHCDYNKSKLLNYGINFAFRENNVRYICTLDSDVIVEPDWISAMLGVFTLDKSVGIVGPSLNRGSKTQNETGAIGFRLVKSISGTCMLLRREVFESLGGFDEDFVGGGYEDLDFCERAFKAGWNTAYVPRVHVHHFGKISRRNQENAVKFEQDNHVLFNKKHPVAIMEAKDAEPVESRG